MTVKWLVRLLHTNTYICMDQYVTLTSFLIQIYGCHLAISVIISYIQEDQTIANIRLIWFQMLVFWLGLQLFHSGEGWKWTMGHYIVHTSSHQTISLEYVYTALHIYMTYLIDSELFVSSVRGGFRIYTFCHRNCNTIIRWLHCVERGDGWLYHGW